MYINTIYIYHISSSIELSGNIVHSFALELNPVEIVMHPLFHPPHAAVNVPDSEGRRHEEARPAHPLDPFPEIVLSSHTQKIISIPKEIDLSFEARNYDGLAPLSYAVRAVAIHLCDYLIVLEHLALLVYHQAAFRLEVAGEDVGGTYAFSRADGLEVHGNSLQDSVHADYLDLFFGGLIRTRTSEAVVLIEEFETHDG